jgi:hypothetical protein
MCHGHFRALGARVGGRHDAEELAVASVTRACRRVRGQAVQRPRALDIPELDRKPWWRHRGAMRALAHLLAVCVTAASCCATAEQAAASGWVAETAPAPTAPSGRLTSLSCTSGTACIAVGSSRNGLGMTVPLAERRTGSRSAIQRLPSPVGALSGVLQGVSCSSGLACTAVGYYTTTSPAGSGAPAPGTSQRLLAERWNGRGLTVERPPTPDDAVSMKRNAVSCVSATACTAVGTYAGGTGGPIIERWKGRRWSIQQADKFSSDDLSSVSCGSAQSCMAVGSATSCGGGGCVTDTEVQRWKGKRWSLESVERPYAADVSLSGVSCSSATACTAVGYYDSGECGSADSPTPCPQTALLERWNGSRWSFQNSPTRGGAIDGPLVAVSCQSATRCTAVGSDAERWNGTTWLIQRLPAPPRRQQPHARRGVVRDRDRAHRDRELHQLRGRSNTVRGTWGSVEVVVAVSCTSSQACVEVGRSTSAQLWNGSTWSIAAAVAATPSGDYSETSQLHAVSCSSSTACAAVGDAGTDGHPSALAATSR